MTQKLLTKSFLRPLKRLFKLSAVLSWMIVFIIPTTIAGNFVENSLPLSLEEFIETATMNDTVFEQILIDELVLNYQKQLLLPAGDLVLSVKQQHEFFLDQDRDSPRTTVSLSKLFPYVGTEISAAYNVGSTFSTPERRSDAVFSVAQPIAKNAFGHATRLRDKIIGLEVSIARHQIIEAYEDYLAEIISIYYDWYAAYENLQIAQSSYHENLKLLDNIKERQAHNIALPIDVNKIQIQVMEREETLANIEERYHNLYNLVMRSLRLDTDQELIPVKPDLYKNFKIAFDESFKNFKDTSRTYQTLDMLEKRSNLQVDRDANDLLPSINLVLGYETAGRKYNLEDNDSMVFGGIQMVWPLGHQVDRAEYEISKIAADKQALANLNVHQQLSTNLKNLYLQIGRESKLKKLADEKLALARSVLADEAENYSYGKVSLNDYIAAVNVVDNNRFNVILHDVLHDKLIIEWLRLTDRLVESKTIGELKK